MPELYLLPAACWRDVLVEVVQEVSPERAVKRAARTVPGRTARSVYRA